MKKDYRPSSSMNMLQKSSLIGKNAYKKVMYPNPVGLVRRMQSEFKVKISTNGTYPANKVKKENHIIISLEKKSIQ